MDQHRLTRMKDVCAKALWRLRLRLKALAVIEKEGVTSQIGGPVV